MRRAILSAVILVLVPVRGLLAHWNPILPGLDEWRASVTDAQEDRPPMVAFRADPCRFEVVVLAAGMATGGQAPPADRWADEHGLTLVANAGMYQQDGRTPVAYLRSSGREVTRHWHKDNRAALVAGPEEPGRPLAALLDAGCDGPLPTAARGYRHVVQGIRMLTCRGENTFRPGGRKAVRLALGVDGEGRLLFVLHRVPITSHDFVERVREAGLDVRRLMYLEGGSEASLVVRHPHGEVRVGGVASNHSVRWARLLEGVFLPLPNVIGLRLRAPLGTCSCSRLDPQAPARGN